MISESDLSNKPVGELVLENTRLASVFSKYNLDYCCKGKMTLEDACIEKNISMDQVIVDIQGVMAQFSDSEHLIELEMPELLSEVVRIYHEDIRVNGPVILAGLLKLRRVHGENHPELHRMHEIFVAMMNDLIPHLQKEELVLFPYIKALFVAKKMGVPKPSAVFGSVKNPITMMELEHDEVGKLVEELIIISRHFEIPPDGCTTYKVTLTELNRFIKDLKQHILVENLWIHPKSLEMEKTF